MFQERKRVSFLVAVALAALIVLPNRLYAAAGDPDTTFGGGTGKVTTDFSPGLDRGTAVAIQPDGKIVVAGIASAGTAGNFALARYNTDGSLDASFGSLGKVTTDFSGGNDGPSGVAIQSDGKIVAAGFDGANFALIRYNANGSPDTSFGTFGKVTTDFSGGADAAAYIAIQADGKIVAVGRRGQ